MLEKSCAEPVSIHDNLTLSVFHGKDGLSAIHADWMRLNDSPGVRRFYQSLPWYRSYLEALEADEQSVSFYVFHRQQSLVAIFPLRRRHLRLNGIPLRCLELPRHQHMYLRDFVCDVSEDSAGLLLSLVSYLRCQTEKPWDMIYMSHVPEDSAITLAMRRNNRPMGNTRWAARSSYVSCGGSSDGVAQNMSGAFRRNLRRLARRAEQTGPLELHVFRTPEELGRAFPVFLGIEASGWKGDVGAGSAIVCRSDLVEFYRRMMEYFSETESCVINLLMQNGTCIAGQFCVQMDEVLNIIKIGYHEAYSDIAPGNLLMQRVLDASCRSGAIRAVSFVTDPDWCRSWRPSTVDLFDHYLFNRTWRGVLAWLMAKGRSHISRFYKGLAKGVRSPEASHQSTSTHEGKA